MKIFKFGGASVKSAESVKHLARILRDYQPPMIVVVSAMGKTTNALETLTDQYFNAPVSNGESPLKANPELHRNLHNLRKHHEQIAAELFGNPAHPVLYQIHTLFEKLEEKLSSEASMDYDYEYDQVVIYGELLSTRIVSAFLQESGLPVQWQDVRKIIKTDSTYRNARVNWELTSKQATKYVRNLQQFVMVQGFIASSPSNINTTLGREGSDYTAAALGYVLQASEVRIWKDVEGVYNADPRLFPDAVKLDKISFLEAVELAYFGAKIIHPKTIQPLENKEIPLYVKSFVNPGKPGTHIAGFDNKLVCLSGTDTPPVYIIKENQILISISPTDFSFIAEDNLSRIFGLMARYHLQVNLMQHGAISFSVCLDDDPVKTRPFIKDLQKDFRVLYNNRLQLITIRHYTEGAITLMTQSKSIYVQQKSRKTARFVTNTPAGNAVSAQIT